MLAWTRRCGLGLLALGLTLVSGRASAKAFEFNDTGWEGTAALLEIARAKLGKDRVVLLATVDWGELEPGDGLLILHPTVDVDFAEAGGFLRAGGRMAVLDDYGTGQSLFDHFQIQRIRAPLKPARMLRQNPNLAIAVPAVQVVAGQEQGRHPVVAEVQQLVTNHPNGLTHPDLTPVLTIPAVGEPNTTIAVTGIIAGRGRLFVMTDPSAVINLMLRYPGNRAFAAGVIEYLVENDAWGERNGKLYLVANDFSQRGQYGGKASVLQEARDLVQGLRELGAEMHRDGLPDTVALILGALAALGAMLWAALVATRPYGRPVPRYATGLPLVAQAGAPGRAAVLSARTTHRGLAALELKSALDEGLASRLGLEVGTGPVVLQEEIVRQDALSRQSLKKLQQMWKDLKRVEMGVAAGQPIRVRLRNVERMRSNVASILEEVEERIGVSP